MFEPAYDVLGVLVVLDKLSSTSEIIYCCLCFLFGFCERYEMRANNDAKRDAVNSGLRERRRFSVRLARVATRRMRRKMLRSTPRRISDKAQSETASRRALVLCCQVESGTIERSKIYYYAVGN